MTLPNKVYIHQLATNGQDPKKKLWSPVFQASFPVFSHRSSPPLAIHHCTSWPCPTTHYRTFGYAPRSWPWPSMFGQRRRKKKKEIRRKKKKKWEKTSSLAYIYLYFSKISLSSLVSLPKIYSKTYFIYYELELMQKSPKLLWYPCSRWSPSGPYHIYLYNPIIIDFY